MAQTEVKYEEVDQIVDKMLSSSGLSGKTSLKFEDFQTLLAPNMDMFNNVSLEWKGQYTQVFL